MYTNGCIEEINRVPQEVWDLLLEIGVPQNLSGYTIIAIATAKILRDPSFERNITQKLYPWLGELTGTNGMNAERRMRHAVEVTVDKMSLEMQAHIFGANINPKTGSITNSNFICVLANTVKKRMQTVHFDYEYPETMRIFREKCLNDMLAREYFEYDRMLKDYRAHGGKY